MQFFKSSVVLAVCFLLGSVIAAPVQLQERGKICPSQSCLVVVADNYAAEDLNYDVLPGKQKNPDQVRDTDAGDAY